ncbi:cation efflux protein [Parathielavia appendiculata]|uniref:Cation efflux protein n=1 Tax=Parathielavia appendiculata TaxID=2587402 RepID=A0AAN6UAI0_9PEZI|nr:cation efflux protein [Parathielavia appendiculata]
MGWSKSTRIKVMLVIDLMFFLLELGAGFAVHSLALMADAFHMLNDIISLLVGLWAVSVARKATTDKFSYGWLRAEILGAFFNAVFLIALCVSIVLEALTRFLDPPEIGNPQLILIVGCLGLASNLAGFAVLGGHGHSHGPGEQGHEHAHGADRVAEEGRISHPPDQDIADHGDGPDVFPEAAVARYRASSQFRNGEGESERFTSGRRERRAQGAGRHGRLASIGDMSIHPASFRQDIIDASRPQPEEEFSSDSNTEDETAVVDEDESREDTPLLSRTGESHAGSGLQSTSKRARRGSGIHQEHNHNKPKKPGKKHGHSHDDLGMNAMILHVIGDALGNVGVIATALIIWLTDWPGRYYADPAVSLFITLIILRSALPLTVAASKILLQATPEHIDLNDVREDIQALPGVISCHHVHIWQLSDTKIIASMHIQVAFPLTEANGEKYMELSKMARKCLHAYGIHSATIQPEFCLDRSHPHAQQGSDCDDDDAAPPTMGMDGASAVAAQQARCGSIEGDVCLLDCVDDCVGMGCCSAPTSRPQSTHDGEASGHSHGHGHGHDHEDH